MPMVFCQDCNFLNYSQGQDNVVLLNIDSTEEYEGQEYYVCPKGHYIFKCTVDALGAETMQALTEVGGVIVAELERAISNGC